MLAVALAYWATTPVTGRCQMTLNRVELTTSWQALNRQVYLNLSLLLISTCVQNPTYTTHTHPQHTDTSPPPPQVLEQKAVPWLTGERNWARWGDWGFSPRTVGTRQRILIQQEVSSGLCSITYSLPCGEESMGHCGNRRPVETPDV